MSAFDWRNNKAPTIFATDRAFTGKDGRTQSHVASENVDRFTQRTGRNPGSIRGLSDRGNLLIEESENKRRKRHA